MEAEGVVTPPSAGEAGVAGSGDANQGAVNYDQTSDDQILSLDTGEELDEAAGSEPGAEDTDQSAEETGAGEGEREGQEREEEQGEAGEQEEIPNETEDPAQLRAIFKQAPELRQAYYRDQAYREVMPTVAEARQYKELAPTVEDLRTAVENSRELDNFDRLFFSQDPSDHQQFFKSMHEQDPGAFENIAKAFPAALHRIAPQIYKDQVAVPIIQSALGNLMRLALGSGDGGQNLKNAVDVIAMRLFGKPYHQLAEGEEASPREVALTEREQSLRDRESAAEQRDFQVFHTAVNDTVVEKVFEEIERVLTDPKSGALKDSAFMREGKVSNPRLLKKMMAEVYQDIDRKLRADRGLTAQLRKEFSNGKRDQEHQDRVSNLLWGRARKLIAQSAKAAVTDYTQLLVGESRGRLNRARQQARPDVTGGAGRGGNYAPGVGPKVDPSRVNYSKTTDEDILSGRVTVRGPR